MLAIARRAVRTVERVSIAGMARANRRADATARPIETAMARIERRRHLMGPGTVSAAYQSHELNRATWERWDWSRGGEEWTEDVRTERGLDPEKWKNSVIELLKAHIPPGAAVLEIGPGGGRWTESLLSRSDRVAVADITQNSLDRCRERFGERVYTFLVGETPSVDLPTGSLDAVWSYDVFVHINPPAADAWLREVARLLRPGGCALIHHGGGIDLGLTPMSVGRSNLDADFFKFLAQKHGLDVLAQDTELPHKRGDVLSICRAAE